MAVAISLARTGGPEVMTQAAVQPVAPGANEVWLEQEAIGVNYLDVTQRKGSVPIPLPNGLGLEAAGRVAAVGSDVGEVAVGDRVAYILGPLGSYASARLYPADRLVRVPDDLRLDDAASILFKGITAQYLLKSTYSVGPGSTVLLYGVAGGLGRIMARWAKHLGAVVIGVVSKASSIDRARAAGCDIVLVWGTCDLPAEVVRLTDGRKADVVYDGIGKSTFAASLDALRSRGTMVSIGASSGTPPAVAVATLNVKGSLFLTRPVLAHHASNIDEYRARAADVFAAIGDGIITPEIWQTYRLADVAAAHAALEGGTTSGSIVLKP